MLSAAAVGIFVALRLAFAYFAPDLERADVAINAAAIVVWISTLLSILPVAAAWRAGLMPIVYAYFVGASVRIVLVLVATAAALKLADLPELPWVATLFAIYLPLLFIEVGLVGKYLWNKRLNGDASSGTSPNPAPRDDDGATDCHMEACA